MLIYKGIVLGYKLFKKSTLKKIQSRPRSKISKTPGKCFNVDYSLSDHEKES